jgi:hypothetical protein
MSKISRPALAAGLVVVAAVFAATAADAACPSGTVLKGGFCVPVLHCPPGQEYSDGKCVRVPAPSSSANGGSGGTGGGGCSGLIATGTHKHVPTLTSTPGACG